jgi:hypothetical protein
VGHLSSGSSFRFCVADVRASWRTDGGSAISAGIVGDPLTGGGASWLKGGLCPRAVSNGCWLVTDAVGEQPVDDLVSDGDAKAALEVAESAGLSHISAEAAVKAARWMKDLHAEERKAGAAAEAPPTAIGATSGRQGFLARHIRKRVE